MAVTALTVLLVGLGGSLGAVLRYAVAQELRGTRLPLATLTVNVAGSFVFGLAAFAAPAPLFVPVAVGVCGAFTTFSSFSLETVELYEDGERTLAAVNAVANAVLCVLAVAAAYAVAGA